MPSEDVHETTERILGTFTAEPTAAALAGRVFRERGGGEDLVDAAETALETRPSTSDTAPDEVIA